jgi:hypothetical protein
MTIPFLRPILTGLVGLAILAGPVFGAPVPAVPPKVKPPVNAPAAKKGYYTHLSTEGTTPCPRKRGHRTLRAAVDCVYRRGGGTDSSLVIVCPSGQRIDLPEEDKR